MKRSLLAFSLPIIALACVSAQGATFKLEGSVPVNIGPDGKPSEFQKLTLIYRVDFDADPIADGGSFTSGGDFDSVGNPTPVTTTTYDVLRTKAAVDWMIADAVTGTTQRLTSEGDLRASVTNAGLEGTIQPLYHVQKPYTSRNLDFVSTLINGKPTLLSLNLRLGQALIASGPSRGSHFADFALTGSSALVRVNDPYVFAGGRSPSGLDLGSYPLSIIRID